jgi:hypothetical protein
MGQAFALTRDHGHDREKIIFKEDPRGLPILEEIGDVPTRGGIGVEDAQGTLDEVPSNVDAPEAGGG